MYCSNCGIRNSNNEYRCRKCNSRLQNNTTGFKVYNAYDSDAVVDAQRGKRRVSNSQSIRNQYEMSTAKWLGVLIILSIPLLNIIFLLIWSLDNSNNHTKYFARAYILYMVLIFFLVIALFFFILIL